LCEQLKHAPHGALAFAAADMCMDQRSFFFAQNFGEMEVENPYGQYMCMEDATKLGRLLGEYPLLTDPHEFVVLLAKIAEIQAEEDDRAATRRRQMTENPEHPSAAYFAPCGRLRGYENEGNLSMAMLMGWSQTPLGNPRSWSLEAHRQVEFAQNTTEFRWVVAEICSVLPLKVDAERDLDEGEEEFGLGHCARPTPAQLFAVIRMFRGANKVMIKRVEAIKAMPEDDARKRAAVLLLDAAQELSALNDALNNECECVLDTWKDAPVASRTRASGFHVSARAWEDALP